MRTYLALYAVSDGNIAILKRHPPYIQRLLNPDIAESMEHSVAVGTPPGFWSILFSPRTKQQEKLRPPVLIPPEGAMLDLDKAWPGIHFLLTGAAGTGEKPLDFLVCGGSPIGKDEDGLLAIGADDIRAIAQALAAFDRDALLHRYQPARMRELGIVPPDRWQDVDVPEMFEDDFNWLFEYFEPLQAFLTDAVANGLGVVKVVD
jgi:hypothetical protein